MKALTGSKLAAVLATSPPHKLAEPHVSGAKRISMIFVYGLGVTFNDPTLTYSLHVPHF